MWIISRGEGLLTLKGAIAIAQEHADIVIVYVRSDDIEYAIAVHITQGHGARSITRGEGGNLKGAITIAQEHADIVVTFICDDDVEFAIAIYIAQGYGVWISSRGVCDLT
jgi:hypothetical protein